MLEHFKKCINEKRCTILIGSNYLANCLLNFDSDEIMFSRLLAVIEIMLSSKSQSFVKTNTEINNNTNNIEKKEGKLIFNFSYRRI